MTVLKGAEKGQRLGLGDVLEGVKQIDIVAKLKIADAFAKGAHVDGDGRQVWGDLKAAAGQPRNPIASVFGGNDFPQKLLLANLKWRME
jgi:hypothetical protein